MSAERETLVQGVGYGAVCALPKEYAAFCAMLDNRTDITIRTRVYCVGTVPAKGGGEHSIACVLADQGTAAATNHATLLVEDLPRVVAVLMVGIAGGVPDVTRAERHVRLGDVVVSGERGVVAYDFIKEHSNHHEPRHPPRPPDSQLLQAARRLSAQANLATPSWLAALGRAESLNESARPPESADQLFESLSPEMLLAHPTDKLRAAGVPRVFIGTIACANRLLKNPVTRDAIRDEHDVRAVEMEGFGIAEASWSQRVGYLVVRGICDYCDEKKNDVWQGYSAVVAAAYARAILGETPRDDGRVDDVVVRPRLDQGALREAGRALWRAATPPDPEAIVGQMSDAARRALVLAHGSTRTLSSDKALRTESLASLMDGAVPHNFISAPAGAGKTVALWRATGSALDAGTARVPLYVPVGSATTWGDIQTRIQEVVPTLNIEDCLSSPDVVLILDGWSEFVAQAGPEEAERTLRRLHRARWLIAGRNEVLDTAGDFQKWKLDLLSPGDVLATLGAAFPQRTLADDALAELLRLPLALCLYVLLGGEQASTGGLVAALHTRLCRDAPALLDVLAEAVAARALHDTTRQWDELDRELTIAAERRSLHGATAKLVSLGLITRRGPEAVFIHDLSWAWLCGRGLIRAGRVAEAVRLLENRESLRLAIESGERVRHGVVGDVATVDVESASWLAGNMLDDDSRERLRVRLAERLADPRSSVRSGATLAALRFRDDRLLPAALESLSGLTQAGIYEPRIDAVFSLRSLFAMRDELGRWVGAPGTDQILSQITARGGAEWSDWLRDLVNAGRLEAEVAAPVAWACTGDIPAWTQPALHAVAREHSWRLKPVAARNKNVELARWVASNYVACVEDNNSGFLDLADILTGCGDDVAYATLLTQFPGMTNKVRDLLGYAIRGFPSCWIAEFLRAGVRLKHVPPALAEAVASEISDAEAREWVGRGPALLGWRQLVARHGNGVVAEIVAALPDSFSGLHVIPALQALSLVPEPPDYVADEIWRRVQGTMEPRAMADVINALARVRNRGIPSLAGALARNPTFLPSYHFFRFMACAIAWQSETGLGFKVVTSEGPQDLLPWLLLKRFAADSADGIFPSGINSIKSLAVPVLLRDFAVRRAEYAQALEHAGQIDEYHGEFVAYLMGQGRHALVVDLFKTCLGAFPEHVLLALLEHVPPSKLIHAVEGGANSAHSVFHAELIRRVRDASLDLWLVRGLAKIVAVHPWPRARSVLQAATGQPPTDFDCWLIRETEYRLGRRVANDDGSFA